jgi:hypothetical protein
MSYCCIPSRFKIFIKGLKLIRCKKRVQPPIENDDEGSLFTATTEDPFVMLPEEQSVTVPLGTMVHERSALSCGHRLILTNSPDW